MGGFGRGGVGTGEEWRGVWGLGEGGRERGGTMLFVSVPPSKGYVGRGGRGTLFLLYYIAC